MRFAVLAFLDLLDGHPSALPNPVWLILGRWRSRRMRASTKELTGLRSLRARRQAVAGGSGVVLDLEPMCRSAVIWRAEPLHHDHTVR